MRSILASLAAAMAIGLVAVTGVACTGDSEVAQAADDAAIGIETGSMFVTIQNKAGAPLLDLTVEIQTAGAPFTHLVTRLEAGEKQDVSLNSFSSRDGTTFNLRLAKPRAVRVTATDLTSKKYEVRAPWK